MSAMIPHRFMMDPFFGASNSRELRSLNNAVDAWASAFMPALQQQLHTPSTDIEETKDAFTLRADAPGFDPEDINVELKDGRITISGRKAGDKKQEKEGKVVRRERTSVAFSRSFALPDDVKEDDISASLDKGVLTVVLPKAEPTPQPAPKRIAVQAHEEVPAVKGQTDPSTAQQHDAKHAE